MMLRGLFHKYSGLLILLLAGMAIIAICSCYLLADNSASASVRNVSVTRFGAVPIEKSAGFNSTSAFQKALNRAISLQVPLIIPAGTFEVDSGVLKAVIPVGKSLEIIGEGDKSVIRRRSHSIRKDSQDMFVITTRKGNAKKITLQNFAMDGNARGNPLPASNRDPYLWQHCSGFRIAGANNSARIKNVAIQNVTAFDPVADHIYFPGYGDSFVDNVQVTGFNGYDRHRTRSDITVTGGLRKMDVHNSKFTRLEVELNRPYLKDVFLMKVHDVDITQKLDISGDNLKFYGERVTAADFKFWKAKGWIRDSVLYFQKDVSPPRSDDLYDFQFINTDFYYPVADDGKVYPLTLNYAFHVIFNHCRFIINQPDADKPIYDGWALDAKPQDDPDASRMLEVTGSWFDPRFSGNIHLDRSGHAKLIDNQYSGSKAALFMSGSKKRQLSVTISGGDFKQVSGVPFQFEDVSGFHLTLKNVEKSVELAGRIKTKIN